MGRQRSRSKQLSCGGLLALIIGGLYAAEPAAQPEFSTPHNVGFGRRVWLDLGAVVTAPAEWNGRDWMVAGGCVGGIALTGLAIDRHFQEESQESQSPQKDILSDWVGQLGTAASLLVIGGLGGVAWASDNDRLWNASVDAIESSIIASCIITPVIKVVAGRARPSQASQDSDSFQPFSGDLSFPSGHTTQAFTVATTYACSYPEHWWVAGLGYVAATAVGLSRINDDAHYMSDVVAGAVIGTFVGYEVVQGNRRRRSGAAASVWVPVDVGLSLAHDAQSLALTWRW